MKENPVFKRKSCKKYLLIAFGSYCLKIIFVLLKKVVAFYMQVSIIQKSSSGGKIRTDSRPGYSSGPGVLVEYQASFLQ